MQAFCVNCVVYYFNGFNLWIFCLVSFPPPSLPPPPFLGGDQSKEDIYFVVLNKEEGSGLGFSVAGGIDLEQKSIIVSSDCIFLLSGLQSQLEIRSRTHLSRHELAVQSYCESLLASFCIPSVDAIRETSGLACQINSDAHKFAKISIRDRLTHILATGNPNISSIQAL